MNTKRATPEQVECLVTWMRERPSMASGIHDGKEGRLQNRQHWEALADRLNAIRFGARKTGEKWEQSWKDLKSNTKKKASRLRVVMCQTGGGPSILPPLSQMDENILAIMGREGVDGLDGGDFQPLYDDLHQIENLENDEVEFRCATPELVEIPPITSGIKRMPTPNCERGLFKKKATEVLCTTPQPVEIPPVTPGPSGIERMPTPNSERGLFKDKAISLDDRYLIVEQKKLLLQEKELELIAKKSEADKLFKANILAIKEKKLLLKEKDLELEAKKGEEDELFKVNILSVMDRMLEELLKRKSETNYHHVTVRYHSSTMDLPNPESVSIKTEPRTQEEGSDEMTYTDMEIHLPDVEKECSQYAESVQSTSTINVETGPSRQNQDPAKKLEEEFLIQK